MVSGYLFASIMTQYYICIIFMWHTLLKTSAMKMIGWQFCSSCLCQNSLNVFLHVVSSVRLEKLALSYIWLDTVLFYVHVCILGLLILSSVLTSHILRLKIHLLSIYLEISVHCYYARGNLQGMVEHSSAVTVGGSGYAEGTEGRECEQLPETRMSKKPLIY